MRADGAPEPLQVSQGAPEPHERALIGVTPGREYATRRRLFAALEDAWPIRFEPRESESWANLAGLVAIGPAGVAALQQAPAALPCLAAHTSEREGRIRTLVFADEPALSEPLRHAQLHEAWSVPLPEGEVTASERPLALLGSRAAWSAREGRGHRQQVAVAPDELTPDEALRDRLTPDRSLAMLALAQFVRSLVPGSPVAAPLRAALLLDDPNLHWPTYGHLRYEPILRHATTHNYHLSVAMVPLDAWLAHPRAVDLFRRGAQRLSITVHGNDHDGPELRQVLTREQGDHLARQALARCAAFQRRTGLPVDPVMVPPHEAASEAAANALRRGGFEAISMTRPYPWLADGRHWLTRPPEHGPLAGWQYSDGVAGGLPVLLRTPFDGPPEELVIRAFLGQPLIVYGHHDDLADGPDKLARAAEAVNALGTVSWGPLSSIARGGWEGRVVNDTLHVTLFSRRASVPLPAGVSRLRVDPGPLRAGAGAVVSATAGSPGTGETAGITGTAGCAEIELQVHIPGDLAPAQTAGPDAKTRVRRLARRVASEVRDRASAVPVARAVRR